MLDYLDYRGVALSAPALRTVVVCVTAWNTCHPPTMAGGTGSCKVLGTGDFESFDVPCTESDIPDRGIDWWSKILPVLALRSTILIDIGGELDNTPECRDDLLFLDDLEGQSILRTLGDAYRDTLERKNHIYRAFVCHWPPSEDADRLRDEIDGMKRELWHDLWWRHHRKWEESWRAANGRAGTKAKAKASPMAALPHTTGPDAGRNGGGS